MTPSLDKQVNTIDCVPFHGRFPPFLHRPPPSLSPHTDGLRQWFMGDGMTPSLDEQVSNKAHIAYLPFTSCTLPLSPHTAGLCQWFMGVGVTPSQDEQVNITDCMPFHGQFSPLLDRTVAPALPSSSQAGCVSGSWATA